MDSARRAAYIALKGVEEKKAFSNIAVGRAIDRFSPERPSFVRELVYGTIKTQLYLDCIIGSFVKTPACKLPVADRILLRLGLYQLTALGSVPDYAAVSETVELAKRYARGRDKFINGVLRSYIRDRDMVKLPMRERGEAIYLSTMYSFAPWIAEMWLGEMESPSYVESLMEALNKKPRFCIRANTLKTRPQALADGFEALGFIIEADRDIHDVFFVDGEKPLDTALYRKGMFSVQDKASRMAALCLGAQPGETVIDVCAAPGGKAMAIAETMKNSGCVVAMDVHEHKIGLIKNEAARLGVGIVTAICHDGRSVCEEFAGRADRVLVDAPCSGLGTARRKPEVKYKEWDDAMEALPELQLGILKAASHYVKRCGILLYSTCTIARRENQNVVDMFLRENDDFDVIEMRELTPMEGDIDGFFICKLKRKGD